jgi:alpha-1,6-mannosyltransferase
MVVICYYLHFITHYDTAMDHIDVLLCFVCVLFAVICPFTKVEESFNIDAIHDFLFLPWMSLDYEHHTFPGVVPRTSLGAFLVALLVYPYHRLTLWLPYWNKFWSLILVRVAMALMGAACIARFRSSIQHLWGKTCSKATGLFILSQFHLIYYASRPLPNTFAMYCGKKKKASSQKEREFK